MPVAQDPPGKRLVPKNLEAAGTSFLQNICIYHDAMFIECDQLVKVDSHASSVELKLCQVEAPLHLH